MMELNGDEDEALFFECWSQLGPDGNAKTTPVLKPLVKKRLTVRDTALIERESQVLTAMKQQMEQM